MYSVQLTSGVLMRTIILAWEPLSALTAAVKILAVGRKCVNTKKQYIVAKSRPKHIMFQPKFHIHSNKQHLNRRTCLVLQAIIIIIIITQIGPTNSLSSLPCNRRTIYSSSPFSIVPAPPVLPLLPSSSIPHRQSYTLPCGHDA